MNKWMVFTSISPLIGSIFRRDVKIVTTLDTLTSIFSCVIVFGILGNLAYETGTDDIQIAVQGGSGLAFVSYPSAISKFDLWPQVFSILFFFMLFVLGLGRWLVKILPNIFFFKAVFVENTLIVTTLSSCLYISCKFHR